MNTYIAKSRKTLLHYFLRIVPKDRVYAYRETDLPESRLLTRLNALLSAKTQKQVVEAIDGLGLLFNTTAFRPHKRIRTVEEMRSSFAGEFEESDSKRLAHEMYLLSSHDLKANASNSSPVGALDAVRTGFEELLNGFGEEFSVIVEPVQDWMTLRNNLSIAASLLGRLVSADDERVLEQAGFSLFTNNKLGEEVYAIADKFNAPFWGVDFISNPLRSLSASFPSQDYLFWLLTKTHTRKTKTQKEVYGLGDDDSIYFTTKPIATGEAHSIMHLPEETDHNLYLCIRNEGTQTEMAERIVVAFFDAFAKLVDTDDTPFGITQGWSDSNQPGSNEGGLNCCSLAARFWKTLSTRKDLRLIVCKRCGDAALTSKRGPAREYCTDSCRVQATRARNASSDGKEANDG